MLLTEPSNLAKRVFKLSLVLTFVSAFIVLFIGYSLSGMRHDIKELNAFLSATDNLQSNFEQSLKLYTEGTEEAIAHTHSLRPASEIEYIQFISDIENTAEALGVTLDLKSIEIDDKESATKGSTLDYQLEFFGSKTNLTDFLKELEDLSYYVKIYELNFTELSSETAGENIQIKIRLYVK